MPGIKSKHDFRILLVYPNLSMLLAPPLAYGIFTALLRREGYQVDIFDVTPYVGEGASAMAENAHFCASAVSKKAVGSRMSKVCGSA